MWWVGDGGGQVGLWQGEGVVGVSRESTHRHYKLQYVVVNAGTCVQTCTRASGKVCMGSVVDKRGVGWGCIGCYCVVV